MTRSCIIGFPQIYIQGPGALDSLSKTVLDLGGEAGVAAIVDPIVADRVAAGLSVLSHACRRVGLIPFGGECTQAEIDRLAAAAAALQAKVVIGAGGGKALDASKGVALALGADLVIAPTIASSDAPTSRLIAIYDEQHRIVAVPQLKRNPNAVLVDTQILARAPRRFFVAGMGDALTKKFEVEAAMGSRRLNFFGGQPTALSALLADRSYTVIRGDAAEALKAVAAGVPNAAFERVVEASILYSGLAFESGGLSIAHGMLRGLTPYPATHGCLHGELVAYALLVQLVVMGYPAAMVDDLIGFHRLVGLPTSLADIGLHGADGADLRRIAELTLAVPYVAANDPPITVPAIVAAIKAIETRRGA